MNCHTEYIQFLVYPPVTIMFIINHYIGRKTLNYMTETVSHVTADMWSYVQLYLSSYMVLLKTVNSPFHIHILKQNMYE